MRLHPVVPSRSGNPLVLVIILVLDEAAAVPAFHQAVTTVLHAAGLRHQLMSTDDRSADATGAVLANLAAADPCVRVLTLSCNFGKKAALTAAPDHAGGDGHGPVGPTRLVLDPRLDPDLRGTLA